jgi:hypothetical protein
MILVYRPELESPPMDKECTIGFSFVTGTGTSEYANVKAGVTRDFPVEIWEKIKNYEVVKNLLSLGALRVEKEEARTTVDTPESGSAKTDPNSISNIALSQALDLVENSFDLDQLKKWHEKENRIKVRNSIMKRISAITEGNG